MKSQWNGIRVELQEPELELTGNFDQGKGNLVRAREFELSD